MSPAERRWLELGVRGADAGDLEPLLAEGLMALGGRAVQEAEGWYVTHLEDPGVPEDEVRARAVALFADLLGEVPVSVCTRWIRHEDWAESWKRGLAPRRLTPRLVVTPSWMDPHAGPGDRVVVVDPGMAFGTAEHGTTRGCLRLLDGVVREGDAVLDVGSGSGILAVAAALLGAGDVLALEGDPLAEEALAENVAVNGVADKVRFQMRWADAASLAAEGPRDGVVANIESGILRPLLPGFAGALRPGGWLILSGILDTEWEALRSEAAAAGFAFRALDADGEWRSLLFERAGA